MGIKAELSDEEENGFQIFLTEDGYLTCTNMIFEYKGKSLFLKSLYNSQSNYPLVCEHEYNDYLVFDEYGNFDREFIEFLTTNF